MSTDEDQGGAGRREVAYRLFAAEFDDADFSYSESDEERAPNYVVTPTGARVNRVFLVGVLTEVETVSEDYLRARVVDPSGPFVVYAGQYQPEALAFLESVDPPTFVAVTGKARTYQPDDSDQVYTSVRPESISEVDAATRDRWVVQTAEQTIDRVARAAEGKHADLTGDDLRAALVDHGVDEGVAAGIPIALERYGTTGDYLAAVRDLATDAARVVAGQRDEVEPLTVRPGQGSDDRLAGLVERPIEHSADDEGAETVAEEPVETDRPDEGADDQRAGTAEATTGQQPSGSDAPSIDDESAGETNESVGDVADEEPSGADSTDETVEASPGETVEASPDETVSPGETTEPSPDEIDATSDEPTDESASDRETAATDPSATAETESTDDDLGEFDPEFELDESEREEIESEYGTEFQSGTEVDEPGAADIDTPDPEAVDAESTTAADAEPSSDAEPSEGEAARSADSTDEDDATDVDLEDAVMDVMDDLDDGDGAARTAVVDAVVDRTGGDPDAVEDAIQDALMGGRCYEPDDGLLKPI
ncbi:hypothetical protein GOC74_12610 [Halomicrobium mukohataei]|uniref:Rpa-associated protein n=1 Tax=Halomicrobium mukohataei TaxID=57705 RepID=A0A847UE52_9EURY|nr:hypothetical protein [Halomicrobium mukohataei]NLV10766.1 hypothetical protein [Halomicrobium mukohataei]